MTDTVFAQIVRGEIPADLVYQDELVTAFRDVQPQAPTHILVVPNKPVPTGADVTEAGYRLILNNILFPAAKKKKQKSKKVLQTR